MVSPGLSLKTAQGPAPGIAANTEKHAHRAAGPRPGEKGRSGRAMPTVLQWPADKRPTNQTPSSLASEHKPALGFPTPATLTSAFLSPVKVGHSSS